MHDIIIGEKYKISDIQKPLPRRKKNKEKNKCIEQLFSDFVCYYVCIQSMSVCNYNTVYTLLVKNDRIR